MGMLVDVLYRGVPVVQGATATAHAAGLAMVSAPAPMPVGTPLELRLADGSTIQVQVHAVHEATAEPREGAPVAGMVLAAGVDAVAAWTALVGAAPPVRATQTLSAVDVAAATAAAAQMERAAAVEPGAVPTRRTRELSSQELAAAAQAAGTIAEPIRVQRPSKPNLNAPAAVEPDGLVDDGKATTVMEAVSPEVLASLGLSAEGSEADASGAVAAVPTETSGSVPTAEASQSMPAAGGKKKKSSKKR